MLIIGELINCTRKPIALAVEKRDTSAIQKIALDQAKAGAHYLDINGGIVGKESDSMKWLVETVQEVVDIPLCLDITLPEAMESGLSVYKNGEKPIINSITDEQERFQQMLPLVKKYNAKVIALCIDDSGMPKTSEDRVRIAKTLTSKLKGEGLDKSDILIDPCIFPLSVDNQNGIIALDAIEAIKKEINGVRIVCGLSNVSYGLPLRKKLNQAFLVMGILKGLDAAILDPCDKGLMASMIAAETLAGRDEYCMNYITAHREGRLDP